MRVIIIEDEIPAANRLENLLHNMGRTIDIIAKLDSVEASVKYLSSVESLDLIFMDIQLADGLSFTIFESVTVNTPVIFTTAFDHYTLKAFKVNSIDYLLKPIEENELELAITKYEQLHEKPKQNFSEKVFQLMNAMSATKYKERLLIKRGQQLSYLKTENIAFCWADGKLCYAADFLGNKYMLDQNLIQLEEQLMPNLFYRVNRTLLVNINAIEKVHTWLGGRLKLDLCLPTSAETVVSRERVAGLKEWLGGN